VSEREAATRSRKKTIAAAKASARTQPGTDKSLGAVFGCLLRTEREKRGMSQIELQRTSGIHFSMISHIERGKRIPTLDVLSKLAKGLGITPGELLNDLPINDIVIPAKSKKRRRTAGS
jgi:ribosome-binding protein aMBF1 (putative translation factor)